MTTPVFSINAASEVLEKDRRTITKALRYTPADKMERGQKRWRLRTILDALDELPDARRSSNTSHEYDDLNPPWKNQDPRKVWGNERIVASIAEFEEKFSQMDAIEDLEQRRAFAVKKLGPLIAFHDTFRALCSNGDALSVHRKVTELWLFEVRRVRDACEWDSHEADEFLLEPYDVH
jgi:hypothetical protein